MPEAPEGSAATAAAANIAQDIYTTDGQLCGVFVVDHHRPGGEKFIGDIKVYGNPVHEGNEPYHGDGHDMGSRPLLGLIEARDHYTHVKIYPSYGHELIADKLPRLNAAPDTIALSGEGNAVYQLARLIAENTDKKDHDMKEWLGKFEDRLRFNALEDWKPYGHYF